MQSSNEQNVAIQGEISYAFAALKLLLSIWPDCDDLIVPNFETVLIIYSNLHLAPSPPTLAYKGAAGRIVPRWAELYVNPPLHPEM